jgi:hypothetical protein
VELKSGEIKRKALELPKNYKKQNIMARSGRDKDPIKSLEENWNNKFTKSNLFKECIICGSSENVEMHHVRTIKALRDPNGPKDFFTRQMQAINRKQIPLCNDHHSRLHLNT